MLENYAISSFTFYQVFWYFVLYSFIGWCLEVVFCTVTTGDLVNRGFLNGPVCPIYGFGMMLVLWILLPLQENLAVLYLGSLLLATALELVGGWLLNKAFHTRWWDYSEEPFNLGGYICLSFSLVWGVGGVLVVRVVHPLVAQLVEVVPHDLGVIAGVFVFVLYLTDAITTGVVAAGLNRDLGELESISTDLHRHSDLLSVQLGGLALTVDEKVKEGQVKQAEKKAEAVARAEAQRAELEARQAFLRARLTDWHAFGRSRLMRAFPGMHSAQHDATLDTLKQEREAKKNRADKGQGAA